MVDFHNVCWYVGSDTKTHPSVVHMRALASYDIDEKIRPDGLQIFFSQPSLKNLCVWDKSHHCQGTEVEIRAAFTLFIWTQTKLHRAGVSGHFLCYGQNWMKWSKGAPDCFGTNLPLVSSVLSEKEEGTTDWTAAITRINDSPFSSCSIFHLCLQSAI